MTALPIERVRGEHHIAAPALPPVDLKRVTPLDRQLALSETTDLQAASLKNTPRGPIWVIESARGESWWNAYTGENIDEVAAADVRRYAVMAYAGEGRLTAVDYLDTAPKEAQARGPLWRASFADAERTRIYLDPYTGEVVSRRSSLWGVYDLFYQIHIMNFGASRSYNHPAIVIATAATLVIVLTGFVLLWIRLGRDLRAALARSNRKGAE
jgi:hypothetical protein